MVQVDPLYSDVEAQVIQLHGNWWRITGLRHLVVLARAYIRTRFAWPWPSELASMNIQYEVWRRFPVLLGLFQRETNL